MQLVILVGQVEGNLLKSGRFRPDNSIIAALVSLRFGLVFSFSGSELVRKQNYVMVRDFPPGRQQNAIVTIFINAT